MTNPFPSFSQLIRLCKMGFSLETMVASTSELRVTQKRLKLVSFARDYVVESLKNRIGVTCANSSISVATSWSIRGGDSYKYEGWLPLLRKGEGIAL